MLIGKGVTVGALALIVMLDASVQEFAELVSLPDDPRRERFHLPPACTPIVSAVKPAGPNSSRLRQSQTETLPALGAVSRAGCESASNSDDPL